MKFKRIIAVMLILCSVFALAACGSTSAEETVKKAGWEKNKNVPFMDYLEYIVITRYQARGFDPEIAIYYTIKLSQDEIKNRKNDQLPVTYTVAVDGTETYEYDMLYKDGALTVEGGKNLSQNQPYDIEIIEEMLNAHLQDEIK